MGPRDTQKRTAINERAVVTLQIQTLQCLRGGRIAELRGILKNFIEHGKIENLARNFNDIIVRELSPILSLRKFVDLLLEVGGNDFHRLFSEFAPEAQAKIAEQIRMKKDGLGVTANLLSRLLLASERRPADKRILQAAAQLASSETLYYFLNNYDHDVDVESRLSLVYMVKYRGFEEIEPVISRAIMDYSKCGPQATRRETEAMHSFRRIMDGFRNLSIRAELF